VTLAGFLLGTVSGSGTATAVSLGSVAWPVLRRAGYPREQAGGMLAAAGIGAILSPPTLGAAAFIRGKRISTGSPKSGTEVIANRLLQAAGLNPETDVSPQRLELGKTVDAMKDGSIDGFVRSGGLPTGGVTDLFTSAGDRVEFIDISDLLPKMQEINPVYAEGTVSAAAYGTPGDVQTIVVPNLLLVRNDFPTGNACAITRLMFDKKADLEKVHPAAKELDPKVAVDTAPVELAPGARTALQQLGGT